MSEFFRCRSFLSWSATLKVCHSFEPSVLNNNSSKKGKGILQFGMSKIFVVSKTFCFWESIWSKYLEVRIALFHKTNQMFVFLFKFISSAGILSVANARIKKNEKFIFCEDKNQQENKVVDLNLQNPNITYPSDLELIQVQVGN